MIMLTEAETKSVKDLRTQEEMCIKKYDKYSNEAKDPELKNLFTTLKGKEQEHYNTLSQVLDGDISACNCNDAAGSKYEPTATYKSNANASDKDSDCYLATDCIATEKLVSSEYNTDVFTSGKPELRKLFADIQIEEQNHAEMLYKYKTVNAMS